MYLRIIVLLFLLGSQKHGYTQEIFRMVAEEDLEALQTVLKEDPRSVNERNPQGNTPLHFAAMRRNIQMARLLLDCGADVNATDKMHHSTLIYSIRGQSFEMIRLMIERGADINARTIDGETPLHFAIGLERPDLIDYLIRSGADLTVCMNDGGTFLHFAAEIGNPEITALLISNGIEVNSTKKYGLSPLHLAIAYGHQPVVEALINEGADINQLSEFSGTPLCLAEAGNYPDIIEYLKRKGARSLPGRFPLLSGKYLGQELPGLEPRLFAPGLISFVHRRYGPRIAFSPDAKEVYWASGSYHGIHRKIWYSREVDGFWHPPRKASFVKEMVYGSPVFSHDGKRLFFNARNPTGMNFEQINSDEWYVERTTSSWSNPINLGSPVNTARQEASLSLSSEGDIYFQASGYEENIGSADIFFAAFKKGGYSPPVNLGPNVNSPSSDVYPSVAPDESYLVFLSARPGGFFQRHNFDFELYISFHNDDGSWTPARNMGKEINAYSPLNPSISPDGKYLFFYSDKEKEFYWVSTKIIDNIKPTEHEK